jgi:hypothetical protein
MISLVLTSLYIYYLYIGLCKVKNSHHSRDFTSLLLIPTKEIITNSCIGGWVGPRAGSLAALALTGNRAPTPRSSSP